MSNSSHKTAAAQPASKPSARHINVPDVTKPAAERTTAPIESIISTIPLASWRGNITLFDGISATQPCDSREDLTWDEFRKVVCPVAPCLVSDKKEATYFLPCLLRDAPLTGSTLERAKQNDEPTVGKMRSKDHVTKSSALIYDFDGIDKPDFERIQEVLEDCALTHVAYTTHSHGREDKPGMRVRLCIPVDQPLSIETYATAWDGFVSLLPISPDRTGSKLYQQQGAWACHPDRRDQADHWSNNAGVLSLEALSRLNPPPERSAPTPQAGRSTGTALKQYPPADVELIAARCNQIKIFRDTRGIDQTEPLWRDCLGVIGHCKHGREIAHDWSSGHSEYSKAETDRKLDHRLTAGPTTCAQFRSTNPAGCEVCTEQVTSPIALGRPRSTTRTAPAEAPTAQPLFPSVELHPEPVDPAELLSGLDGVIRRYVVLDPHQGIAIALWIAHSWLIESADIAPLLLITAAERESGKSQALSVCAMLCRHSLTVANSSPAFLFRGIAKWMPTLFIDEVDTFMRESTDQKGLINAGHTRDSAWVGRVIGDSHEPTMFPVFCAKALAGINLAKHLPDSTMSRGIIIVMQRKRPHETCDRLRHADREYFRTLRAKQARFALDYADRIKEARPTLPEALSDRQQDNWEPLFSIAECVGPEWLARCEEAALALSRSADLSEDTGNNLLADIREIFELRKCAKISSADLIEALIEDEEAGWATYNHGKSINPRQVARLLRPYGIVSKTVRLALRSTPKGYDRAQFDDAFARYLAPPDTPAPEESSLSEGEDSPDVDF